MSGTKKRLALALAATAVLVAPSAFATNGYFAHGYSTKEKGLAGAGVALSQDALAAATNPAGMVMLGDRMDLGAAIFSPSPRSYTASPTIPPPDPRFAANADGTKVESGADYFLIPSFGRNWMLDANSSVGLSIYGNGGMNTDYPSGSTPFGVGTFGAGTGNAGVNLAQLFVVGTYASKINPTASWGVSGIFAYQRFRAYGIQPFQVISNDPANLSDNGNDTSKGFGIKFGVQGEVAPGVTLGASYQSEMSMDEFDKYKGLFAEQGGFDIPSTWTVGLAWKTAPNSHLTFDVQRINYTDVPSVSNPFSGLTTCGTRVTPTDPTCLGGANGIGFGWEDMTIAKIGYQWQTGHDWTWRLGFSKGDQPIPSSEVLFNILAPGVMEEHVTFGFTKQMSKRNEFTFAAMFAPSNSVTGRADQTTPLAQPQTIELKMSQYELAASWSWVY